MKIHIGLYFTFHFSLCALTPMYVFALNVYWYFMEITYVPSRDENVFSIVVCLYVRLLCYDVRHVLLDDWDLKINKHTCSAWLADVKVFVTRAFVLNNWAQWADVQSAFFTKIGYRSFSQFKGFQILCFLLALHLLNDAKGFAKTKWHKCSAW